MLRLRPYKKCDAAVIAGWIQDEFAFRQWSADRFERFPLTADALNAHYEAAAFSDDFYEMTAFDETGVVGHLIMRYPDADRKTLRFGFVIVDSAKRGKGYGKGLLYIALRYAFEIMKAEKVSLGVFENNPAAYYCYRAVGFRDVAMDLPESYCVMGQKWLCREMEITRGEFAEKGSMDEA